MNRRATISALLGKSQSVATLAEKNTGEKISVNKKVTAPGAITLAAGLDPYVGPFDQAAAAHLLRRVTFGPSNEQIAQAVSDGLEITLQKVFSNPAINGLPLNVNFDEDPNCSIGDTWIDKPYTVNDDIRQYRTRSLYSWTAELLLDNHISIREKMVLFWHNHFATSDINDPKFVYNYSNRLRTNALGNFKTFVKEMIIDPTMLRYLNGNQNQASAPNENFARELLELFTIGKGDIAGPGDYTFYTEGDIQQISKALTGWVDRGWFSWDETQPGAEFIANRHDTTTKTLSNRFGNAQITDNGANEYEDVVDIILQQDEVAKFIVRKIYRWFVYYDITDDVEQNVIEPLAAQFRDGDYEIQPIVETLLRSDHFFGEEACGCMIKNPMDFVYGIIRQFQIDLPSDSDKRYEQLLSIAQYAAYLQMAYYNPPNVAGWKSYYQEPTYYQIWINSVSLPQRIGYAYVAVNIGFDFDGDLLIVDPLKLVDSLVNPYEVGPMIDEITALLLPKALTTTQKIYLKSVLIPGLPDFEWNVEYSEYASDPTNEDYASGVRNKLKNMFSVLTTMAEFQLM